MAFHRRLGRYLQSIWNGIGFDKFPTFMSSPCGSSSHLRNGQTSSGCTGQTSGLAKYSYRVPAEA
jgi:hypothetical protein